MALKLTERPCVLRARLTLFARRLLRPLINFSSTISWAPQDQQRCVSVLLHLTCATGNIHCKARRVVNSIAAFRNPILPSSYGLILSECGGKSISAPSTKRSFLRKATLRKQKPSPRIDENGGGEFPRHKRPSTQLGIRHLLGETRYARSDGWTTKDLCFQRSPWARPLTSPRMKLRASSMQDCSSLPTAGGRCSRLSPRARPCGRANSTTCRRPVMGELRGSPRRRLVALPCGTPDGTAQVAGLAFGAALVAW
jgi:hypothetical protein